MLVIGCFLPRIIHACVSKGCMYSFRFKSFKSLTPWTRDVGRLPKGLLVVGNVHVFGSDKHIATWVIFIIGDPKTLEDFSLNSSSQLVQE